MVGSKITLVKEWIFIHVEIHSNAHCSEAIKNEIVPFGRWMDLDIGHCAGGSKTKKKISYDTHIWGI